KYINEILKLEFIKRLKLFVIILIFFVLKKNDILRFCVNYCSINNIIIANRYSILLIFKILNCLKKIRIFTKFDLRN
ncbi:hypothetical protein BDZ45DRAFT_544248, partial [Acephala macrosclerotiorum]